MKVPDLLELVREKLQGTEVSARQIALGSGVGYDSVLRIKREAPHDPTWHTVKTLADYLLTSSHWQR
jgi:hypothetical protein